MENFLCKTKNYASFRINGTKQFSHFDDRGAALEQIYFQFDPSIKEAKRSARMFESLV